MCDTLRESDRPRAMKTVINKTRKPLRIRLPGGKTLFLGVAQQAPFRDEAAAHPPVKKLLDAGEIEIFDGPGQKHGAGSDGLRRNDGGQASGGGRGKLKSGDR